MNKQFSYLQFTFLFLVLHLFINDGIGQSKKELKYKEDLWSEIKLSSLNEQPEVSDTMVVICTLRKFTPNEKRFFGDQMDSLNTMRYLLAIRKNNSWKLFLMNSIDQAASYLKKDKDIVFYIEGMGKTFTVNLYRSAGLSLQYNVNTIVLDYPSVSLSYALIRNFNYSRKNAKKSVPGFVSFLESIEKYKNENKTWIANVKTTLFIHSIGNTMLKKAVTQDLLKNIQNRLFTSLVLNAPCVNQRKHAVWVDKIQFSKTIYINYNKQDFQLNGAMLWTFKKQLGARINKPLASNTNYVNFNEVAGKQHNLFLSRPGGPYIPVAAFKYYNSVFHGQETGWDNTLIFSDNKNKIGKTLKKASTIP